MSRTRRGSKGPGYEYWSKRATESGISGPKPGKEVKKSGNRNLRRKNRSKQWLMAD